MPPRAGQVAALHDAGGEDEQIIRAERVGLRLKVPQQKISNYRPPADEQAVKVIAGLLNAGFGSGQVNVQNFSVCSTNHCNAPSKIRAYCRR
jgi:hypothetical protein